MKGNYILAKYDISGIQDYIFATNRLQENAGASYHVALILEQYLPEAMTAAAQNAVIPYQVKTDWKAQKMLEITENPKLGAEIVYIGGGNAMVIFQNLEIYEQVNREFAYKVVSDCEGLTVAAEYVPVNLNDFRGDYQELGAKLAETKAGMSRINTGLSYPIVEQDPIYGLPITKVFSDGGGTRNMSTVQYQKRCSFRKGYNGFDIGLPDGYGYGLQTEELYRQRGNDSYVAVIHIDGNGMGALLEKVLKRHGDYQAAVPELRKFSENVAARYAEAYKRTISAFAGCEKILKTTDDGKKLLPLRPVLMSGDDLTLICGASIGMAFAVKYLRELMELNGGEEGQSACGGIAFVHGHFPFRLAYEIAEACCSNAKQSWEQHGGKEKCWVDYHVVRDVYLFDFNEQRQRYREQYRNMDMIVRPYCVTKGRTDIESAEHLVKTMDKLSGEPRSRQKKLYEAYLEGEESVRVLAAELKSRGYHMPQAEPYHDGKKKGSPATDMFDALELLELCDMDLLKPMVFEAGAREEQV